MVYDLKCKCGLFVPIEFQRQEDAEKWAKVLNHSHDENHEFQPVARDQAEKRPWA